MDILIKYLKLVRKRIWHVSSAFLTISLLLGWPHSVQAGIYSIRVIPSVTQATTGTTFTVYLQANMVVDQYATGYIKGAVTYPADLVQLQSVVVNEYPLASYTATSPGQITVSSPDKGTGNGYGGQQKIITATFKAIAGGTATFSVNNGTTSGVMIVNGTNHVVVAGTVNLIGCAPGTTGTYPNCTTPTPLPTTTPVTATAPKTTVVPSATAGTTSAPTGSVTSSTQTAGSRYGQIDAVLDTCLTQTLGTNAYQELTKLQARLTYTDITKAQTCFAQRKSVVPAIIAPVEPTKIKELPVKDSIKVEKVDQTTQNNTTILKFSGKAAPNQTVVIYLFSDPLVLIAKADQDGTWSYQLEDPMEPGSHEAYVTVEGSGNEPAVRSAGINFAIVAAPKTALNPTGLSLNLETTSDSKNFVNLYVAGAVIVTLGALAFSLRYIRRRTSKPVTVGIGLTGSQLTNEDN